MTSNGHESGKPLRAGDPRELDGYRIVSRLGRGGMGTVYLAKDSADRSVAVKLIHPDLADDESFRLRFAREVASARRVARFSTAGVIDARLEGEPLFIVSEYVPGPNLDEAVRHGEPMHGGTLEGLAMGVAAALTAIHGSGIVHRDLKPANVLLSPVGPKVIDFGIARALDDASGAVTRSSQLMGTPSYMAPELILGEQATAAADIFAWGCLVAFAGTGKAPFDAGTVPAVLHNISSAQPKLDGLDPSLLDLVGAALDKKPENRPTSQQLLARLTGQQDPEEAVIRRTISTSWAPPSSSPVPGLPPQATDPELAEQASGAAATPPQDLPSGPAAPDPTTPVSTPPSNGFTPTTSQQASPTHQGQPPVPPTQQVQSPYQGQQNPAGQFPHANPAQSGPQSGAQQGGYGQYPNQAGHGGPGGGYPPAGQHQQYGQPSYGQPPYGQHGQSQQAQAQHGQAPYGQSPSHGQPAHTAYNGPGGPGGPNGPGGPGGPGQRPNGADGNSTGGRRKLLLIGGAAAAVTLVVGVGATVLLSGSDSPPEDTTSIYVTDFATDPGWSGFRTFDPDDPEETDGYWDQQNALILQLDPGRNPSRGEVAPYDRETPERVLISTDLAPLRGPAETSLGVRCWDQEGDDERTMYEALLRFDGEQAQIRRVTEESGDTAIAETRDVPGFETFDLLNEERDADVEGLPYDVRVDDLTTNHLQFACEYVAEDGDDPYMDLRLWVNGELVLSATDQQPLPDDSGLDDDERRRVGVVVRPGAGTEPVAAVYTNYALHRINVDD
ncbi:serine/threonine-protein kinase [Nocardiopsis metallicus]|uniref:Serine/threonine protein kinase n=1 Tax=Nocardiopsis metallicus TaxID=179819 RepID=A0A840W835_9ACTN|nr:serine/threonine-protein kinase [Nocardiopsis metallicus]MBB5492204.1 serine/threonine protein kinase [Nocardiopsis metallicus]